LSRGTWDRDGRWLATGWRGVGGKASADSWFLVSSLHPMGWKSKGTYLASAQSQPAHQ
jgi:hypothetical protein